MDTLIPLLNLRYQTALESSSDSLFYQNIHAYIDLIIKDKNLSALMDASEAEYRKTHSALWRPRTNDEKELDRREETTFRIERFSLYASNYVMLLVRIYLPIEEYKNPSEGLENSFDPVTIIMLHGLGRAIDMKLWDKKHLKSYNNWYDGKRKFYEKYLRQFHADLLTEIMKAPKKAISAIPEKKFLPLHLNLRTGDFTFFKTTGSFSPMSQEFKVLKTLYEAEDYQVEYLLLLQSYMPNTDMPTKALKDNLYQIVRNIKEKLGILPAKDGSNPDIIKTIKNLGYRLSLSHVEESTE